MTFLLMLSVILLSMLMILSSSLSVIRHLICDNQNRLLNLNLICETLWAGAGSSLLISMLEKLNWCRLTGIVTLVLLVWKWVGLFLWENDLLRCWGCLSLLNFKWDLKLPNEILTLSLFLKVSPRKLEPWFVLWSFFLPKLPFISINLQYGHA